MHTWEASEKSKEHSLAPPSTASKCLVINQIEIIMRVYVDLNIFPIRAGQKRRRETVPRNKP